MRNGVSFVLRTEAKKLTVSRFGRPVAVTHVSQSTCPDTCAWKGSGCYAELGPEGMVTRRLAASEGKLSQDAGSSDAKALHASLEEARQIWAAAAATLVDGPGSVAGVPLRLHVVGDAAGGPGAVVLGRAVGGWLAMGGGPAWTYTHRWASIARGAWGPISVLASCEDVPGALRAGSRGYAVAMVTAMPIGSVRAATGLPGSFECPQQTGGRADCASCMACARIRPGRGLLVLRGHGPGGRPTRVMAGRLAQWAGAGVAELSGASEGLRDGVGASAGVRS